MLDARSDTNLTFSWQHQLTDGAQVQLQYTRDVKLRDGPAVHGLQMRLAFFH